MSTSSYAIPPIKPWSFPANPPEDTDLRPYSMMNGLKVYMQPGDRSWTQAYERTKREMAALENPQQQTQPKAEKRKYPPPKFTFYGGASMQSILKAIFSDPNEFRSDKKMFEESKHFYEEDCAEPSDRDPADDKATPAAKEAWHDRAGEAIQRSGARVRQICTNAPGPSLAQAITFYKVCQERLEELNELNKQAHDAIELAMVPGRRRNGPSIDDLRATQKNIAARSSDLIHASRSLHKTIESYVDRATEDEQAQVRRWRAYQDAQLNRVYVQHEPVVTKCRVCGTIQEAIDTTGRAKNIRN